MQTNNKNKARKFNGICVKIVSSWKTTIKYLNYNKYDKKKIYIYI